VGVLATWKDGDEILKRHPIRIHQRGDNEALMGWYVANEGAVRSKGTMCFALHQHGQHMTGRWVGLSYDGPVVTGFGVIARTEDEIRTLMDELRGREPTLV
jgi:hypothetical protein